MSQKTTVFWGDNPSQMYIDSMLALLSRGKELTPRGKRIKELRPVVYEFHNPLNQVTFLKGRAPINPFFQLAESLWILSGGSDVESLTPYNKSIAQFSDDGMYFNAPYGERLRSWGKNDANKFIFNPIDQLLDCYNKLKADPDTRQAVAFIGNPQFDNSHYTLNGGKDIACNINIKFKIRDGKLDITVDNRSNDLHWGVFGANLCQFSTIQQAMASWLGIPVGTYFQETDSLHIYLDEYGAKETNKILKAYYGEWNGDWGNVLTPVVNHFSFTTDPRITTCYEEFHEIISNFNKFTERTINSNVTFEHEDTWLSVLDSIGECADDYLKLVFQAMFIKQAHNRNQFIAVFDGLRAMADSQWKVACLRFLSKRYNEMIDGWLKYPEFKSLYSHLDGDIKDYIERKGE